jgi:hypothetical protein
MAYVTIVKDKKNIIYKFLKKCNVKAPDVVNENKLLLVAIGQGEGDTK